MQMTIPDVNQLSDEAFVSRFGGIFEHSPWVAEAAAKLRPFDALDSLHAAMCDVVRSSGGERQVALIAAHPDLVGNAVLTAESTREQAAAGLGALSADEANIFRTSNAAYRAKFGFPFVICARKNKKEAILEAFPRRLQNSREEEIQNALAEIYQIARLRLADLIV